MAAETAMTTMVNLTVSCLVGQITRFISVRTSFKKATGFICAIDTLLYQNKFLRVYLENFFLLQAIRIRLQMVHCSSK